MEKIEKSDFISCAENEDVFFNSEENLVEVYSNKEEDISENSSYLDEDKSEEFKDIDIEETIKIEQLKDIGNNEMKTLNIYIPNLQEIELQALARDKNLKLVSPMEEYENQYTVLDWICLKCNHIFSASRKAVKKNMNPCPNCREHKGGVQRKKIIDYKTGDYSQEVVLSEILREVFRIHLNKTDVSNSELGRLLKYEIKQALNDNTEFSRWIIYRFFKRVNNLLTNDNKKKALKGLREYGKNKGYFLEKSDFYKTESDLAFSIWYAFSIEYNDDTINGYKLSKELNSDINDILKEKRKISISVYLKFQSICKEKLHKISKTVALHALKVFGKKRGYIAYKDAPNYLELRLAKNLWRYFSNQYKNKNMTFQELSRDLYHEGILNDNIRKRKRFGDTSLDDFEKAIKNKLTGNNYDKAMQSLTEYRQNRPPIYIYTEKRREKTSKSMTEKWTDEDYLEKMESRKRITGGEHYRWNLNRDLIINDILDFDNSEVKTMTQIAEKHGVGITHVRNISINEVEGIYPKYSHEERFPADFFSLIGHEVHWIIKYIVTAFFLDLGFRIYSEIIIDLISKVHVDQFLLNIKDQKYLSEILKNDEVLRRELNINDLDVIIAFSFDYTNDTSDVNIEVKRGRYQKDDMILFIVGTKWSRKNKQETINTTYKNIRIIKHDLFSRLIGLKGKHLMNYEHAIRLSYKADLDGLKDFHNKIKSEFISKYRTELSINRYKTGLFYNDDLKKDLESMGIDYTSFFN